MCSSHALFHCIPSFSAIACNFNVLLASLELANTQITIFNDIFVDEIINVHICPNKMCESVGTCTFRSGDLFYDLARANSVALVQMEAFNASLDLAKLEVGQVINMPGKCHNETSSYIRG